MLAYLKAERRPALHSAEQLLVLRELGAPLRLRCLPQRRLPRLRRLPARHGIGRARALLRIQVRQQAQRAALPLQQQCLRKSPTSNVSNRI